MCLFSASELELHKFHNAVDALFDNGLSFFGTRQRRVSEDAVIGIVAEFIIGYNIRELSELGILCLDQLDLRGIEYSGCRYIITEVPHSLA